MNVALTDEAESFVLKKLGAGEFASAEAVVERALDAWQAREMFARLDSDEFKQLLLDAVRSPLRPYRTGQFVEFLQQSIAERQSR